MEIHKVTYPVCIVKDPEYGLCLTDTSKSFTSGTILGACLSRGGRGWAIKVAHRHSEGKPRLWLIKDKYLQTEDCLKLHDVSAIDANLHKWLWDDPE